MPLLVCSGDRHILTVEVRQESTRIMFADDTDL